MGLFTRLPFGPVGSAPIVAPDTRSRFPALAPRFEDLDDTVATAFARLDHEALANQRSFRRVRLALLVASAATAVIGGVQAALHDAAWPGIVLAVVGLVATALSRAEAQKRPGPTYLEQRARAEELRSLYFRYLGGIDPDVGDRRALERAVAAIEYPSPGSRR